MTMRIIKTILTFLGFIILIDVSGQSNLGQIPNRVKHSADSLVNLLLGPEYFAKTRFDCENSLVGAGSLVMNSCQEDKTKKKRKGESRKDFKSEFYVLKYQLALKANSKYTFEVRIDRNLKLKEKICLPDCINTSACKITVDSLSAIDLAIRSGLVKRFGIYNEGLVFDTAANSFQWEIRNQTNTKPDSGELINIDAVTGERIRDKDRKWLKSTVH